MSRDLNDRHREGGLEIDVAGEPLPLVDLPIEEAEDMWLSIIALTPARADYSKVQREHLSHRGRIILEIIRAHVAAGWPQIAPEHLTSPLAGQVRAKYWAQPALRKTKPEELDLRGIPARLRNFAPEDVPLEAAEESLIRAWKRSKMIAVLRYTADMAEKQGVEEAESFLSAKTARMAALTAGVQWRSFGEVAKQFRDLVHHRLQNPEASANQVIGTGFPAIDRMVRHWGPRKFTVIAGWNGHGKSSLIAQLLSSAAVSGTPGFYISGEDEMLITVERILSWLLDDIQVALRLAVGQPAQGRNPGYTIGDVYALDDLIARVEALPLQLLHLPGARLGQVTAAITDGARKGARIGAHDYLSTISKPASWDETDWRNNCIRTIKTAFISNGMHGIEGAQLVRPKDRDEKSRPSRYMIGNCPAAEECGDYVILVHRKFKGQTTKVGNVKQLVDFEQAWIYVDKSKDGPVGELEVSWDNQRHRFHYREEDAVQTNFADRAFTPQEPAYDDDF